MGGQNEARHINQNVRVCLYFVFSLFLRRLVILFDLDLKLIAFTSLVTLLMKSDQKPTDKK